MPFAATIAGGVFVDAAFETALRSKLEMFYPDHPELDAKETAHIFDNDLSHSVRSRLQLGDDSPLSVHLPPRFAVGGRTNGATVDFTP